MKKAILIILVLLLLAGVGAGIAFGLEKTEDGSITVFGLTTDELQVYLKEKIVPLAVAVISAAGTIYVGISPVLNKVKSASSQFESATESVRSATGDVKENKKYVERIENELKDDVREMKKEYERIDGKLCEIEHVMLLAFTNSRELVSNGSAHKIATIIHDGEIKSNEEDNAQRNIEA